MNKLLSAVSLAAIITWQVQAEVPRPRQNQGQQNPGQQNPVQQNPVQQHPGHQGTLPEGHWISQKQDVSTGAITIFENWFELDPEEGRVAKYKQLSSLPAPAGYKKPTPNQGPGDHTMWRCYAHDYIDGHEPGLPKTPDCIQDHYKGKNACKEDAIELALRDCRRKSSNKRTCDIDVANNCWPDSARPKEDDLATN